MKVGTKVRVITRDDPYLEVGECGIVIKSPSNTNDCLVRFPGHTDLHDASLYDPDCSTGIKDKWYMKLYEFEEVTE